MEVLLLPGLQKSCRSDESNFFMSSSISIEIIVRGGSIEDMVPPCDVSMVAVLSVVVGSKSSAFDGTLETKCMYGFDATSDVRLWTVVLVAIVFLMVPNLVTDPESVLTSFGFANSGTIKTSAGCCLDSTICCFVGVPLFVAPSNGEATVAVWGVGEALLLLETVRCGVVAAARTTMTSSSAAGCAMIRNLCRCRSIHSFV